MIPSRLLIFLSIGTLIPALFSVNLEEDLDKFLMRLLITQSVLMIVYIITGGERK